jgi:hypothetical protein
MRVLLIMKVDGVWVLGWVFVLVQYSTYLKPLLLFEMLCLVYATYGIQTIK